MLNEDNKIDKLTLKQRKVLLLVAQGVKYKDVAVELGITERTVKYYMEMILNKLQMENRRQAVNLVIQEGLVS